ncbi:MAG: glycosyltransferase [Bacillota bacterium]
MYWNINPGPPPLASVIFPARDEGHNVVETLESLHSAACEATLEAIVVDDGSSDGCCNGLSSVYRFPLHVVRSKGAGAAGARNLGAQVARGRFVVFCDAHLRFPDGWLDRVLAGFDTPLEASDGPVGAVSPAISVIDDNKRAGFGETWNEKLEVKWLPQIPAPAAVPLLPGGCVAFRTDVFNRVGGFDRGFTTWGHEDEEISIKLWLFGHAAVCVPEVMVGHLFRPRHPYRVTLWDAHYNLVRMAYSHFSDVRLTKTIDLLSTFTYRDALVSLVHRASLGQRQAYFGARARGDDWFFERFAIPF